MSRSQLFNGKRPSSTTTVEVWVRSGTRGTSETRWKFQNCCVAHQTTARPQNQIQWPWPDRGSSIPHPGGTFWGGATARLVEHGASRQCRECRDPPLALARDSATERRIRCPGAGGQQWQRCAAGGWRALCWDNHLQVRQVDTRHWTLRPSPLALALALRRTRPSLSHPSHSFFLVSKARPFIPLLAPNCSRFEVRGSPSGPPSRRIAGVPEETGNRVAGPGLARRPLSLSLDSVPPETSSPQLPLTIPITTDDASRSFILTRPAPPRPHPHPRSFTHSVSSRRVLIRSQRRSFLSSAAVAQSRALLSLSDQGRGSVGRSGRLLHRRPALP